MIELAVAVLAITGVLAIVMIAPPVAPAAAPARQIAESTKADCGSRTSSLTRKATSRSSHPRSKKRFARGEGLVAEEMKLAQLRGLPLVLHVKQVAILLIRIRRR
jgi:hypothetical protein